MAGASYCVGSVAARSLRERPPRAQRRAGASWPYSRLSRTSAAPRCREVLTMPGGERDRPGLGSRPVLEVAAERAKPFFDLLAMVHPVPGGDVIDLGCGTGELTAQLHADTKGRRNRRYGRVGGDARQGPSPGGQRPSLRVRRHRPLRHRDGLRPRVRQRGACSGFPTILGCCAS